MIVRVETTNIQAVERIAEIVKQVGFEAPLQVMRLPNKTFVVAIIGQGADSIKFEIFNGIYGIRISRDNKFFLENHPQFKEYWQFLEEFGNQRKQTAGV